MKTKTLNVVMIATNTKTNLLLSAFNTLFLSPPMEVKNTDKYQCLCFTSNDKFEENDWVTDGKTISQVIYLTPDDPDMYVHKKIEATTHSKLINDGFRSDTKVLMPSISQAFVESYIKAYNQKTIIETVDVEMEEYTKNVSDKGIDISLTDIRIKTNSENEVIIASQLVEANEAKEEESPKYVMELFYIENDNMIQEWSSNRQLILKYTKWLSRNNYKIIKVN